jgi:ABC-type glycerol-3-phosphate transport system substrate-binding protein
MERASKSLSRREMLKLMGMTAGAVALASCAPAAPAPEAPAAEAPAEAPAAEAPAPTEAAQVVEAPPTPTPGAVMVGGAIAADYEAGQAAYGWYDEWHPASTVDLVLWGPTGPDEDPFIAAVKAALTRFGERYPEIKVTYEPVPGDQIDTKVNAAVAAGQGPDLLFEWDREGEFPRRGAVRDIPSDVLPPQYIKDHKFYEVRPLDDGKLYWVHTSIMGPILFANKAILAEAGVKPEDTPKTWDEFGKFCQQLTKFEGDEMLQAGFAFNAYSRYIWNDMLYQQKARLYENPKKSLVNTPESRAAWQMLLDMYDKYKINDRAFLNFDEAFGTGKAAFAQVWTWFGSALEKLPRRGLGAGDLSTFGGADPMAGSTTTDQGWM